MKTINKGVLGVIRFLFYSVPYPIAIIIHAIYGVLLAAALGYRGYGPKSFPVACIVASVAFFYLLAKIIDSRK